MSKNAKTILGTSLLRSLDTERIEEICYLELMWSYSDGDERLVQTLSLKWSILTPSNTPPPAKMSYTSNSDHIYFEAEALSELEGHFYVVKDAFLYSQEAFNLAGGGPQACPNFYNDLERTLIDLTKPISKSLERGFLGFCARWAELAARSIDHNGGNKFLKSIHNLKVRESFQKCWETGNRGER